MTDPLPPGSKIGILGGGQLGRMLSVAAARLGYVCHIFEPGNAPAAQVAARHVMAGYDDVEALKAFANGVDVVTLEFENIPLKAAETIAAHRPLRPGVAALEASQDRLVEKQMLNRLGLATAPFQPVEGLNDLNAAIQQVGRPAILKTCRLGYDGKGQVRINEDTDLAEAWASMAGAPSILEGFVDFSTEISVIAARSLDGSVACFDPGENIHRAGILRTTTVPAKIRPAQRSDAVIIAAKILNQLDYVGVMGVELFVTPQTLLVNEIAPRVHNSGHWTQNGCAIDQFEQHIRAITGWPLGDGQRHADVVMENLIGDDLDRIPNLATQPDTAIHLYGKAETRAGRKMGHVNRIQR